MSVVSSPTDGAPRQIRPGVNDTSDILAAMLGLSETEIDALYAEQIVHRTEPFTTPQVEAVNP